MNKIDPEVIAEGRDGRTTPAAGGADSSPTRKRRRDKAKNLLWRGWDFISLGLPDASSSMFRQKTTAIDVARYMRIDENGDVDETSLNARIDYLQKQLREDEDRCNWTVANELELLLIGAMSAPEMKIEAERQMIDARQLKLGTAKAYEDMIEKSGDDVALLRTTLIRLICDIQGRFRKRYLLREYVAAYTARVSLLFGISTMLFMSLIIFLSHLAFDYEKKRSAYDIQEVREQPLQRKGAKVASANATLPAGVFESVTGSNDTPIRSQPRTNSGRSAGIVPRNTASDDQNFDIDPIRAFSSFYIAVMAGLFGAAFSMMAQTRKRVEVSSLEDMKTNARFAMLLFRLGVGIGAAMILYFIFDTKVLGNGALTPDLKQVGFDTPKRETRLIAIGALSPNRDLSLLMLWCFIAGFSEVLVPSILRRTEGEGIPKEAR